LIEGECAFAVNIHGFISGATMFQYYVKIVPTTYVRKDGAVWQTNQFSVTRHQKVCWLLRNIKENCIYPNIRW